jgi:hypothetical protein
MSESRLTRLEAAVFGWTGSNGLIGDAKSHAARIREVEDTISTARHTLHLLKWASVLAGGALGVMSSEQIAAVVAAILKLLGK